MRIAFGVAVVALSLAGCSSLTPVNDPVYLRLQDLEARLIRIEKVLDNESLINLATDVSTLRDEVQSLRGDVETLGHDLDEQGSRNRDLYVDLDNRMSQLEDAQTRLQAGPVPAGGGRGAGGGAPVSDQAAYEAAFALVQQQNFAAAQQAFESFLANHPASSLRPNAQYWLGETNYGQAMFKAALAEFEKVVQQFPQSNKMPDALLKIGYCNYELHDLNAARQALLRVVREYPDTQAAMRAQERLTKIAQEQG